MPIVEGQIDKQQNESIPKVETMSAKEAVDIMRKAGLHITPTTLRKGIANGQYPFGTCVLGNNGRVLNCTIYKKDLLDWLKEKAI